MSRRFKIFLLLPCLLTALSTSACFSIYKKDIRQGNHITQKQMDALHTGMSKEEVQSTLGTPALIPIFNVDTWHYPYRFQPGDGRSVEEKALSLHFKKDRLQCLKGHWHSAQVPNC